MHGGAAGKHRRAQVSLEVARGNVVHQDAVDSRHRFVRDDDEIAQSATLETKRRGGKLQALLRA